MRYEYASSIQSAVFTALSQDAEILHVTQGAIFDHVGSDQILPEIYVRIGDEQIRNKSSKTNSINESIFEISVFSKAQGYISAKKLSSEIARVISSSSIDIEQGSIVGIWFLKSQTYRLDKGNLRQIKLWFKALIDENNLEEVII